MVVVVVQLCNYTKSHCIVLFKWVSCMECELYLSKAIFFIRAHQQIPQLRLPNVWDSFDPQE